MGGHFVIVGSEGPAKIDTIDAMSQRAVLVDAIGILAPGYAIPSRHAPADNTAAVVTIAAVANSQHYLDYIAFYYDDPPTADDMIVEDGGGTTVFSEPGVQGPIRLLFGAGLQMTENTALVVTLAAGGAGIAGILNIGHHTLRSST